MKRFLIPIIRPSAGDSRRFLRSADPRHSRVQHTQPSIGSAVNGNATLAAARRFCDVTSTDYVQSLLDRGQLRAAAEGLAVRFQTADAEALPFADNSFDVAMSTFGVMFTPDQFTAASCVPGA